MNNNRSNIIFESSHGHTGSVDTEPSLRVLSTPVKPLSLAHPHNHVPHLHDHVRDGSCSCVAQGAVGGVGPRLNEAITGPSERTLGLTTEFPATPEQSITYEDSEGSHPERGVGEGRYERYPDRGVYEERVDPQTGKVVRVLLVEKEGNFKSFREAMTLPEITEQILSRWCLHEAARQILEPTGHRMAKCMRQLLVGKVGIHTNAELTSASFSGVMLCGLVWACPICASRITERRRQEVRLAIREHEKAGGTVIMATRTFPHYDFDNLRDLMACLTKADGSFKQHRRFKKIKKKYGIIGFIRALEVTYGLHHGWHPHFHDLLFLVRALTAEEWRALERELYLLWCDVAQSAGLGMPDVLHGLRLDDARLYVSKWGCDHELTKQHVKTSRSGYTPWQILQEYAKTHDEKWADLFREYVVAFRRKHQLQWSKGLKKHFKIKELTDKQILQKSEETQLVCELSREQWYTVVRHNAQGMVLALALTGGAEAIFRYIDSLEKGGPDPPSLADMLIGLKVAQSGDRVRVECVLCKVVWQSYEPGAHVCPECGSHLHSRVMSQV